MAVEDEGSTYRPSLPKLLALEKDFSGLDEQLQNAARIIGLPHNWDGEKFAIEIKQIKNVAFNPRAEWVLRWLLDKLKATDENGQQSRARVRAWILLNNVILLAPVSNAARLLTSANFLAILERALEESLRALDSIDDVAFVENADRSSIGDGDDDEYTPITAKKLKRKRHGRVLEHGQESKRQKQDVPELLRLFAAIYKTLDSIILKSGPDMNGSESISCIRMQSVLQTDSEAAARLLSLWMKAIEISVRATRKVPTHLTKVPKARRVTPFWLILEVWESRRSTGGIETVNQLFSRQCLINGVSLLSSMHKLRDAAGDHTDPQYSEIIFDLESLLASHIFIPAREHYAWPEPEAQLAPKLSEHLEPLTQRISSLLKNVDFEGNQIELTALFDTLPLLFEIAIASAPRDSPRKRIVAAAWLESVLKTLAATMSCEIPSVGSQTQPQAVSTLERMLQIAKMREISVSSETLETIIRDYSGLLGKHCHDIRWSLILLAVELDRDVLLPRIRNERNGAVEDPGSLDITVFAKLSEAWLNKSSPSESIDFQTRSIVCRLMQNYSHGRNLAGFFRRWYTEVSKSGSTSVQREHFVKSLWEEPNVLPLELRSLLEKSITLTQLSTVIQEYARDIRIHLTGIENDGSTVRMNGEPSGDGAKGATLSRDVHAALVILNALLGAISAEDTIDGLREVLLPLQSDLTRVISQDTRVASTEPAAWRILSRLFTFLWPNIASNLGQNDIIEVLDSSAMSCACSLILESLNVDSQQQIDELSCEVGSNAFAYALNVCCRLTNHFGMDASLCERIYDIISIQIKGYATPSESDIIMYIGNANNLSNSSLSHESLHTFQQRLTQALLIFPKIIEMMPSEPRQVFFRKLFWDAFIQHSGQEISKANDSMPDAVLLLHAFMEVALSSPTHEVRDAMLAAVSTGFENQPDETASALASFSEDLYLRMPIVAVPRKHRVQTLNHVSKMLVECLSNGEAESSPELHSEIEKHLSVIVKLMEVPNTTANIVLARSNGRCELTELVERLGEMPCSKELKLMQQLVMLVMRHIAPTMDQTRSQDLFLALYRNFTAENISYMERPGPLVACKEILLAIERHNIDVTGLMGPQEAKSRRELYLQKIFDDLVRVTEMHQDGSVPWSENVNILMEALSELPFDSSETDVQYSRKTRKLLVKWRQNLKVAKSGSQLSASGISSVENWVYFHKLLARFLVGNVEEFLELSEQILRCEDSSPKGYGILIDTLRRTFRRLDTVTKISAAHSLLTPANDDASPSIEALRLLYVLLSTLENQPASHDEKHPGNLLGSLCRLAEGTPTGQYVHAVFDCVLIIVREKPWLTSQYGVDTLLATATTVTRRLESWVEAREPSSIYLRLCEVANTLISLHRTKLGGRYHILMQLLQNLLSCLFASEGGSHFAGSASSASATESRLDREHSAAYARLLSTLCSPTMSSASGRRGAHKSQAALVDPTKKAKAYAGEYVRFVIMEYVHCTLQGRLVAEGMREALMPGIWAAMEACGEEGLRNTSVALDASGRAILRGLVAEWRRERGGGG